MFVMLLGMSGLAVDRSAVSTKMLQRDMQRDTRRYIDAEKLDPKVLQFQM